jgi:ParB-like chromosome segregation protein Spo0J
VSEVVSSTREGWRNRITGHADVPPAELVPHSLNARRHPQIQAAALDGVLSELGWIQSVVVSQATGRILDGHLRVERALAHGEPTVPVVYVDVTEAEEAYAQTTTDPLSAMASTDADALSALLERVASILADAPAVQAGEGRAALTATLQEATG